MLKNDLENLIDLIRRQKEGGKLNFEELEAASSSLIVADNFDSLPDFVKDEIYLIDMHEIEDLNSERLSETANILEGHISQNDN